MMRVAVTDATGVIGRRVAAVLAGDRHEVLRLIAPGQVYGDDTPWPDAAQAQDALLSGAKCLFVVGLHGEGAHDAVARHETEVIHAALRAGVEKIVLLSSTDLYRPAVTERGTATELSARLPVADLGPLARAAHDLEQVLREVAGEAKITVIRVPMVLSPDNAQARSLVSQLLDTGDIANLPDRLQGIDGDDLAEVLVSVLRAPRAVGYALNLAGPTAAHMEDILSESQRLYTRLTDLTPSSVNLRPEYRYAAPLVDAGQARKVLPKRANTELWVNLAELVQAYVQEARASGALPPLDFPISPAKRAIEERQTPLNGRVALVTGATDGIGHATALMLSRLGADVIGVGRNQTAGAELEALSETDPRYRPIRFIAADLTRMSDLHALAAQVAASHARLDFLINNAGAAYGTRTLTLDGLEASFALNTLAPFALPHLLLDQLLAADAARVINLNTNARTMVRPDFDDLQSEADYAPMRVYATTKQFQALLTRCMADMWKDSAISVHAIHPGTVRTEIETKNGVMGPVAQDLGPQAQQRLNTQREARRQQMISPQEAAAHVVNLAMSPEFDAMTGLFLDEAKRQKEFDSDPIPAEAWTLWDRCARLAGLDMAETAADDATR